MAKAPGYKGMTSEEASIKKVSGHINEFDYASLIGGEVNKGSQSKKTDVVDKRHGTHSVKSGKKWQIFLYGKSRFASDNVLKGVGRVSDLLIDCIDALPLDREERVRDSSSSKQAIQGPMQELALELANRNILRAFLTLAAFDGGQVSYWAILPPEIDQTTAAPESKKFHVFHKDDVIEVLMDRVEVVNSKARNHTQRDNQKVVFRTGKNLGEIEIRTDAQNYRRAKLWFLASEVLRVLGDDIPAVSTPSDRLTLYGKARSLSVAT